jgi:uncharacterized protein YjbI with pentapeptide repeats
MLFLLCRNNPYIHTLDMAEVLLERG